MADRPGTPGDDVLVGTPDGDWIEGFAGDDVIRPGGGSVWGNTIAPGPGQDWIYAEEGANATFDTLFYGYAAEAVDAGGNPLAARRVEVDLQAGYTWEFTPDAQPRDFFRGIEGVVGSATGSDRLLGSSVGNFINGLGGDDYISGRGGGDGLWGGDGDDRIFGGSEDDELYGELGSDELHGEGENDTLSGGVGLDVLYGEAGNDRLFGDEDDDRLDGGEDSDMLAGGSGNDLLFGDDGNDTLVGGPGADRLGGGSGWDTFRIDSVQESDGSYDHITDFGYGDRIDVSKIDADEQVEGDQAFASLEEATATSDFTAPGQILFYSPAGAAFTFVWLNNDADHFADARFVLDNGEIDLSASDFVL